MPCSARVPLVVPHLLSPFHAPSALGGLGASGYVCVLQLLPKETLSCSHVWESPPAYRESDLFGFRTPTLQKQSVGEVLRRPLKRSFVMPWLTFAPLARLLK